MTARYSVQFSPCRDQWRVEVDYGDGFPISVFECDEKQTALAFLEKFCERREKAA